MRVDGSLMGIDDKAGTLIPQWKRGHFSLLFDGRPVPATLLLVDHRKKTVVDLTKEKKKHQPDIDDEVRPAVGQFLFRHTIITLGGCRAPYTPGQDDGNQEVCFCLFIFHHLVQRLKVLRSRGSHARIPICPWFFNGSGCNVTSSFSVRSQA